MTSPERPGRSHAEWTTDEEELLTRRVARGHTLGALAAAHERTLAAIQARLERLGLPIPEPVGRRPGAPAAQWRRWSADDRRRVVDEFLAGTSVPALAKAHECSPASIRGVLRAAGANTGRPHPSGDPDPTLAEAAAKDVESSEITTRLLIEAAVRAVNTERNTLMVLIRWGLRDGTTYTLRAVGDQFGISRERVRQIEARTTKRLATASGILETVLLAGYLRKMADPVVAPGAEDRVMAQLAGHLGANSLRRLTPTIAAMTGLSRPELERAIEEQARRARWLESQRGTFTDVIGRHRGISELLADAIWAEPDRLELLAFDFPSGPVRSVRADAESPRAVGSLHSVRMGRSVAFESSTERLVITALDSSDEVARFCEQPVRIPLASPRRYYVPDLIVEMVDGRRIVVEVKPAWHMADAGQLAKWDAALGWCAERGLGFVVTDGCISMRDVQHLRRPAGFDAALTSLVRRWPQGVPGNQWARVIERLETRLLDLVSAGLQGRCTLQLSPFSLDGPTPLGPFLSCLNGGSAVELGPAASPGGSDH